MLGRRARLLLRVAPITLAVLALACSSGKTAAPPSTQIDPFAVSGASSGAEPTSTVRADTRPIVTLAPGTCFDIPTFAAGVAIDPHDVDVRDCTMQHQHEVYAALTHPAAAGSQWPGAPALDAWGNDHCLALFDAYVGIRYELSSLDLAIVRPDEGSWANGDRAVSCTLHDSTFALLTGSMAGQNR